MSKEFQVSRLWPSIEASAARRIGFAVVLAVAAAAVHWAIYPLTQGRTTFLFFVPAIVLATTLAGRVPGVLVALAGIVNSALMRSPGQILVPWSADQVSLITTTVASILIILVGDYYRSLSRRELSDLNDLHELSTALASIPTLPEQLKLILSTFVRMHGAEKGIISIYDYSRDRLVVAASQGFSPPVIDALRELKAGEGASGLAVINRHRVVIEDADVDPRVIKFRELQREEGVRSVHSTPLIGKDGHALGALSVHLPHIHKPTGRELRIADICARKAAVFIERARAEELAQQRDRRFRSVLESSAVPFVVFSPVRENGRIIDFRFGYVNTAAANVMRMAQEQIEGRPVSQVLPNAWDDRARFDMYLEALEKNEVRESERQTAADGNLRWYHVIATPLDGDLAVWFADITQRKNQERDLIEADRRKDEFLATLAHELRNPLAPIRQAATIARNEKATDAQKRWSHDVIERQVHHMSVLLDDLLDVSRISHGTLQLRRQDTNLKSIVDAAVETAQPLIDERGHTLRMELADDLRLHGDPLRLAQVLSNLLTNAAKYTAPGGLIRVQGERRDGELVIAVEDNGIGIPAEDLGKVFEMFAQVGGPPDNVGGGLGIGLALAKAIVELHGGTITADSEGSCKGSRFTVRLPALAVTSAPAGTSARSWNGGERRGKRILLADDNRDAAESLAIILRMEGHHVDLAYDGPTALARFAAEAPEIALLDIGMPGEDGYEVARRIRATPAGRDVTLIAVTGWAQDTDRAKSREAGFDHHLTKPVEPEALLGLVARSHEHAH